MNRIRPIESTQKPMIRKCMICHTEIDVAKGEGTRIRHNKEKYKTICCKCLDFAVRCAPIGTQARIYSNLKYGSYLGYRILDNVIFVDVR